MTVQFEDILSALCSQVKLSHGNDFQKIYLLSNPVEAKLAYDALAAYGFDVKVYPQSDTVSKLYITHPKNVSAQRLEQLLSAVLAYARTLKQIKENLDHLCTDNKQILAALDYSMTFANAQPSGKQILIQIKPAAHAPVAEPLAAPAPEPTAAIPAVAAPVATQTKVPKKFGPKLPGHYEELSTGPEVGRGKYPGRLEADGTAKQNSARKRIMLYLFGNAANSSFAFLIMVAILGVIFSLFIFAKSFLCPDFAVANKNRAWYCQNPQADAEDAKREQQQQRQKQIGIQPTEPTTPR